MTDKHYSIRELADKYNLNYRLSGFGIKTNQVKAIKVKGVLRIKIQNLES